MAKADLLSLGDILSVDGLYLLGYSWLFGMSVWISFFGGVIAYKTLPRQQFGQLQHKTFPIYFVLSLGISSSLLAIWIAKHPDVTSQLTRPTLADVAQVYALGSVLFNQGLNKFVVGPLTSSTMFARHKLEKEEGKVYSDPGVSQDMLKLNRRFGMLHGISSLANLFSVISLVFHGLYIGKAGVKGY
ncbi:hypothetical protein CPB83DRAFT_888178 [Crepidotus variabilis]|uniref:TMEM205-like domain-containing protein n=1 Tax=Crepidotus variabilis TaxID=179855 RepID=A0A9P6EV64_9AGAR|nr:hypothetical protein CPB83DRAFT_888178 [Crepidotus variabilis]